MPGPLFNAGTFTISAGNNITFSTGPNQLTIHGATGGVASMWPPQLEASVSTAAPASAGGVAGGTTTFTATVFPMVMPNIISFNNVRLLASYSVTTATTSISSINYSFSAGASFGLYTLSNNSTLNLLTDQSYYYSLAYTNATSANATDGKISANMSWGGGGQSSTTQLATTGFANLSNVADSLFNNFKMFPMNWTTDSQTINPGQYFGVLGFTWSTAGANQASMSGFGLVSKSLTLPPEMFKATASTTGGWPLNGIVSLTISNSVQPATIHTSKLTTATNNAASMNQSAWIQFFSR